MKELIKRTITALFLIIPAYLLIEYLPPLYFSIVVFLIISGAAVEFIRLTNPGIYSWILVFFSGLLIGLSFTFEFIDLVPALIIILLLTGSYFLFTLKRNEQLTTFVRDMGIQFLVIFYLYIPLYFLHQLQALHPHNLFFLLFVIAIGDTAAYLLGKAFGKHKIYPIASPKKSLQGLIAAAIFAAASGWLSILIFPLQVIAWKAILTGGIIGLLSQVSDPIESLFKRAANQKDSSNLLPGHGGILDRVDSYIFCAPVLFYIILYLWS